MHPPFHLEEQLQRDPGIEVKLWVAAGNPRSNMDAAEYKHVLHGLGRGR